MVRIEFSSIKSDAGRWGTDRNMTLAIGEWYEENEIKIEKVYSSPVTTPKKKILNDICDGTPATEPTALSPIQIQFDDLGQPGTIAFDESDCSVSTLGDSVYDDATPRKDRRSPLKAARRHSNIMFGSF